mgnify:CR=1 FL=1
MASARGPRGGDAESGNPSAVTSLTIQMDSFTFDQSEVASEGSYEASLDSYEESGASLVSRYPVMMDPSGGYTMEPVYEASGGYYPAPNGQQQPGYWSEYTWAVTQGPGGQAVTQLSLSPQVVVTVLPAPPPPTPCGDHTKPDQREPEANNNIVESQESSASSSVSPSSPSTLCDSWPGPRAGPRAGPRWSTLASPTPGWSSASARPIPSSAPSTKWAAAGENQIANMLV